MTLASSERRPGHLYRPFGYSVDSGHKEVEQTEGLAVAPPADRLYLVSD